jgi:uncharacterized protein
VLLPGNRLPLHVFEDPYVEMIEDALSGEGYMGVIQPLDPPGEEEELLDGLAPAPLQQVGCAGRLVQSHTLPDRRFVVVLAGVSRFRFERELPPGRAYRRVVADYSPFAGDQRPARFDPSRLLTMLAVIDQQIGGGIDYQRLSELPGLTLLNQLSALLPFAPEEKQALLEAADPAEREEMLLALLEMGMLTFGEGSDGASDLVM